MAFGFFSKWSFVGGVAKASRIPAGRRAVEVARPSGKHSALFLHVSFSDGFAGGGSAVRSWNSKNEDGTGKL